MPQLITLTEDGDLGRAGTRVWVNDGASASGSAPVVDPVENPGQVTVAKVLDAVGDDKDKAAAALAAEQARGDEARSTLVEKLRAIAEPAE